jgi:transcriptional regulator with XRE-family HTH domain
LLNVPITLKTKKPKEYSETPQTLGEHLKKRRKELGLLQREVAKQMGVNTWTYLNWEKGKTEPVASQFRPVIEFLGYDPTPEPKTLGDRLQAKRRATGMTFDQVAFHLGWDAGSLTRYLKGSWQLSPSRSTALEAFLEAEPASLASTIGPPRRR